ncbi:hypothetical protein B4107_0542 [Bacillus safensis]|nr:hypothetical protein B4107_0542 [Bacillus safensis]
MNLAKVLATSLGAPILVKAFMNCFSVHFSPLSIIFAILAEFFLIQAAAFGLKGFNALDSNHPPERKAPLKALYDHETTP